MQILLKPLIPFSSSSTLSSASGAGRLDLRFLDGLRAIAAVLVVLHHVWLTFWFDKSGDAPAWTLWLAGGHTVPVFIVISGFCLMLPVVRGDGSLRGGGMAFLQKRARRIVPPYYFAIAFALLLDIFFIGHKTGGFWDGTLALTWNGLLLHLLLLQNFSVSQCHTINHAFWSLSLEWGIYLLFPGLVWAWKRLGAGATTLFCLAASAALGSVCSHLFQTGFTLNYVGLFALGMLAAEIVYTRRPVIRALRDRLSWSAATWGVTGVMLLAMTGKIRHFSSGDLVDMLAALWTMSLLVLLSVQPDHFAGRVLSRKSLVFCGTFAYSIYLVHAPLIQLLWRFVLCPLHIAPASAFALMAVIGVPAMVGCAYVFHLVFERPFMTAAVEAPKAVRTQLILWPTLRRV